MADLVVVLGIFTFFAVCVLLVRACDWIVGPDPTSDDIPADGIPEVTR